MRGVYAFQFLMEDKLFNQCSAATAVFFRPMDTDPTPGMELLVPSHLPVKALLRVHFPSKLIRVVVRWQILREPGPQLLAECFFLGSKLEIHRLLLCSGASGYVVRREL